MTLLSHNIVPKKMFGLCVETDEWILLERDDEAYCRYGIPASQCYFTQGDEHPEWVDLNDFDSFKAFLP